MRARFSGHQTFPLRYGWLFKGVNYINDGGILSTKNQDLAERAITSLGIGTNMVSAMNYWVDKAGFIVSTPKQQDTISDLGKLIFESSGGLDPFMEDIGTIWLMHFLLNFNDEEMTAYRYFFNYGNFNYFDAKQFVKSTWEDLNTKITIGAMPKQSTVNGDAKVLFLTYAEKRISKLTDDSFSSPLINLGLLTDAGGGFYQTNIGEKPSLPMLIFFYTLVRYIKYFNKDSGTATINFEDVLHNAMSPGRIFKLDEQSLGRMLDTLIVERSDTDIKYIDSMGLKQISVDPSFLNNPEQLLREYYV